MTNKAELLFKAYRDNAPLEKGKFNFESTQEAYQVQDDVLALKEENGEKHQGYKISLTSKETQDLFNSDSPLFGQMTDVTVKKDASLSLTDYNEPLLETELVFLVQEDVNGDDTDEENVWLPQGLKYPMAVMMTGSLRQLSMKLSQMVQ